MAFTNEQHRQRYAEDPECRERKLAVNRGYHAEHREALNERRRERSLARLAREYGIAFEELRRMLSEHDGTCDICRRRPARRLCIDHCHATMKVRGLLCQRCNTALGLLEDDPERLRAAIGYLERARGAAPTRGEISVVAGGAALAVSGAAAGHVVVMRAEAGRFGLSGFPCPGRSAARSDALQTRDGSKLSVLGGPGSAAQHSRAPKRIEDARNRADGGARSRQRRIRDTAPPSPRPARQARGGRGSRPRLLLPDCVSAAVPEQRCSTRARQSASKTRVNALMAARARASTASGTPSPLTPPLSPRRAGRGSRPSLRRAPKASGGAVLSRRPDQNIR